MGTTSRACLTGALLCSLTACDDSATRTATAAEKAAHRAAADEPIASYRSELLEIAFGAASAFPLDPHVKNRSRTQEVVVATCLELGQPERALRYLQEITNWRRGACYADLALYCVKRGATKDVRTFLDSAARIAAETAGRPKSQDWQVDRIRGKIARVLLLLGETDEARRFTTDLEDSEAGLVVSARAEKFDGAAFDEFVQGLDTVFAAGNFEEVRSALAVCVKLFARFYEDADRRTRAEQVVRSGYERLPPSIRFHRTLDLAKVALDREDRGKARELVIAAQALLERGSWRPEHHIPLLARMAGLRGRTGDLEKARHYVDVALAMFENQRDSIINIDRAGVLRSVAEACVAFGDRAKALAVYERAVEEGVVNPNSRPRAVDLAKTCCSLARHELEPDADLMARLVGIRNGLGDPW